MRGLRRIFYAGSFDLLKDPKRRVVSRFGDYSTRGPGGQSGGKLFLAVSFVKGGAVEVRLLPLSCGQSFRPDVSQTLYVLVAINGVRDTVRPRPPQAAGYVQRQIRVGGSC